jgi:hypothetical protein
MVTLYRIQEGILIEQIAKDLGKLDVVGEGLLYKEGEYVGKVIENKIEKARYLSVRVKYFPAIPELIERISYLKELWR